MKARNVIILLSKNKFRILLICLLICIGYSIFFFSGLRTTTETDSIERVKSLPYVNWTSINEKDVNKSGVTRYDPKLSYKGINIYLSGKGVYSAHLLDMSGNILHTFLDRREKKSKWKLIKPYQNNDFLVLIEDNALFMIDWDSNIKWIKKIRFHHDMAVADNGDIYSLINKKINSPQFSSEEPILDNCLVILTKDGEIKKEVSFAKMILENKELFKAAKTQKEKRYCYGKDAWGIFHTNSVDIINRDIFKGTKKLFNKGDVLFCIRHLNIIGVIDVKKERIIWSWGLDELDYPHHTPLLGNGNILIFDNGTHRKYSRVIELNPITEEIEWEYKANPPELFFSQTRGSAQRFPNGNTLITESAKGRVFEVTKDGEIVWEFYNPEINEYKKERAIIYRMMRITDLANYPKLKRLK